MRGILSASNFANKLWPTTMAVPKALLPIYDKPMIYYSLSVLLLSGIKDILIISTPEDTSGIQQLLGGGEKWGINLSYAVQPSPDGLSQIFILGSEFIGGQSSALIFGNNIFCGTRLTEHLRNAIHFKRGAKVFAYPMQDSQRFGAVVFDADAKVSMLDKGPAISKSHYAVSGLFLYDNTVVERVRQLKSAALGRLEMRDINKSYLQENRLTAQIMDHEIAWLEIDTHDSLLDASKFIENIERHQNMKVGCPEEICWRMGYIDDMQLENLSMALNKSPYGQYLENLLSKKGQPSIVAPSL